MVKYRIKKEDTGDYLLINQKGRWRVLDGPFLILPLDFEAGPRYEEFEQSLKKFLYKYFDKETLDVAVFNETNRF